MLTEPPYPTRTEQADDTAAMYRAERTRRAQLLRELRRAGEDARELLTQTRAEFQRYPMPNPDRARECRRQSLQALDRYNALMSQDDGSVITDIYIESAAEDADVWAILSIKARY